MRRAFRIHRENSTVIAQPCPVCGDAVTRKGERGPVATYCTETCRRPAAWAKRKESGRYAECLAARRAVYIPKPRQPRPRKQKLCSLPDCGRLHRAQGLCSTHYNRANDRAVELRCEGCDRSVLRSNQRSRSRYRVVCSTECRAYLQNGPRSCPVPDTHPSRSTRVPITHPSRMAPSSHGESWRVFIRDCWICSRVFATPYTAKTCSPECKELRRLALKKLGRDKRRASKRGAFVAPVYRAQIYERDRWSCHLCGKRINKNVTVPHPKAPTIDHVVPLAAGGTHEPANVRAAHYLCNVRKGHRGGGEQLMLVG